jgi:DNA-directed RNA polymerase specialized sigma24 family protein
MASCGDEVRIERVQAGDRAAFVALFESELPALWRLATRCCDGRAEAEALVRAVLIHAFRSLSERPADRSFADWLRALAAARGAAAFSAPRTSRGSRLRAGPSPRR